MRARYYNPNTGRFISEDAHWNPSNMIYVDRTFKEDETKYPDITASLQACNLYGYCMNNPLIFGDPFGLAVYATGVSGSIGLGATLSAGSYYIWDDNGNSGIMISGGIGGGVAATIGADTMMFLSLSNIDELSGTGTNINCILINLSLSDSGTGVGISYPGINIQVSFSGSKVIKF